MMRLLRLSALVLLVFGLFPGCSLDYRAAYGTEELPEEIPDMVMRGFYHVAVTKGKPVFRIYAQEAASYTKKKQTLLYNVSFEELNTAGEVITQGLAEKAVFYTDTEDAEFIGSMEVYSAVEEALIVSDYLYWNDEKRLLSGAEDARVFIKKDSGTELIGVGFVGDMERKVFSFSSDVTGVYVLEED